MPIPPTAAAVVTKLLQPTFMAILDWVEGRADEPPALEKLGIPESTKAELRQRAKAAKELRG